jgi:hydrogenase-4 component F
MIPFIGLFPIPLIIALCALLINRQLVLARITAVLSCLQTAVSIWLWLPFLRASTGHPIVHHGFRFDCTSAFFVILTSVVTAAAMSQAVSYFAKELKGEHKPGGRQVGQFYFFTAMFLLSMYVVVTADNLGFLWIGMEATTLFSAPLVYYHRTSTSLEATWKYLIVCSVGIALGFFGTALFYAASQHDIALRGGSLSIEKLTEHAAHLPIGLLRLGYVFILLGYGAKAGLFPIHSWLPDAHSEAPAPTSAMMSGALLNCALVALWRVGGIMEMAGQRPLVLITLLPLGVLTVVTAALFLIKQHDLKRMLAYSSMENVGLMAVAIALGSPAGFALQALNHSLVKAALFLLAGSILQQYGTKKLDDIKGMLAAQPAQALLLFALLVAVAGTPPFGGFLSEWQILTVAADQRQISTVIAIVAALAIAFIALSIHAAAMILGPLDKVSKTLTAVRPSATVTLLLAASLVLGIMLTPAVVAAAGELTR